MASPQGIRYGLLNDKPACMRSSCAAEHQPILSSSALPDRVLVNNDRLPFIAPGVTQQIERAANNPKLCLPCLLREPTWGHEIQARWLHPCALLSLPVKMGGVLRILGEDSPPETSFSISRGLFCFINTLRFLPARKWRRTVRNVGLSLKTFWC
jgi:hypothetical protein